MRNFSTIKLGRTYYWIWVVVLLAMKTGIALAMESGGSGALSNVDTFIVVALAFVVAARFADAGWPRWIAAVLIILIMFVAPLIILLAVPSTSAMPEGLPNLLYLTTAALAVLLVVAGIRPSAAPDAAAATPAAG